MRFGVVMFRILLLKGTTTRLHQKPKNSTVSAFLEWHTLQGMVWSRTHVNTGKRDKRVLNIAYFCVMV